MSDGLDEPPLPPGRAVHLPGRGTVFVREAGRRRGGPTLVLLHGWTVTADLTFYACYGPLAERHHVVALDHRGHGRGLRLDERFTLEACADDVAALSQALDLDQVVPVGYSMGGTIAQLLWRRHRRRVAGLVLAATARNFRGTAGDRVYFTAFARLAHLGRLTPVPLRQRVFDRVVEGRFPGLDLDDWAFHELARSDPQALLEAGSALGSFTSHHWVSEIDVPTAVVVTAADTKVPPRRQHRLAAAIPDSSSVLAHDADHADIHRRPELVVPTLLDACEQVVARIIGGGASPLPRVGSPSPGHERPRGDRVVVETPSAVETPSLLDPADPGDLAHAGDRVDLVDALDALDGLGALDHEGGGDDHRHGELPAPEATGAPDPDGSHPPGLAAAG